MMQSYATDQGTKLLRRLVFRLNRAATLHDPDSLHDLRVAIRRFQQFLRVFQQFLPPGKARKIRRELRQIMKLSGEVRNRDIASALIKQSGDGNHSRISSRLAIQRKEAHQELLKSLDRLNERGLARKWHSKLGL
jgi:CHAD domain-containing protein